MHTNNLPLVSVVMATYNGSAFIHQQMESVLAQSYPNIEVIVVDDRSTDNTVEIINDFREKYPRIKIYVNETNIGYIKNFEKGCQLAAGDYIALCDQDDYWLPEKITKMQAAIGDYPVIYCDSVLCNEALQPTGENISSKMNCRDFDNCLQQAIFCRIYGHATLINKNFLQKVIPFLSIIPHDWWLCYTATFYGGIKYFAEPLVQYRQHANNIFGAAGIKGNKQKNKIAAKQDETEKIRARIKSFYEYCPAELKKEKKVLRAILISYNDFSIANNFRRMFLFFRYHKQLLASKKRSRLQQYLFCLKMFVKIK